MNEYKIDLKTGWYFDNPPYKISYNPPVNYEKRNAAVLAYAKAKGLKAYRCKFFSDEKEYVYFGLKEYVNSDEALVETPSGDFKVVKILGEAVPDVSANFEYKFLVQKVVVDTYAVSAAKVEITKITQQIENNKKIANNEAVLKKYGVDNLE